MTCLSTINPDEIGLYMEVFLFKKKEKDFPIEIKTYAVDRE